MSWGLELWDRVDAVIGQITEDTDELGGVFNRWVFAVELVLELILVNCDDICWSFD